MTAWKRISAMLCCLLLTLCWLCPVSAASQTEGVIDSLGISDIPEEPAPKTAVTMAAFMTPTLQLLPQSGDAESLATPTDIIAQYSLRGFLRNLSAEWDFDSFDAAQTGRQTLTGEVILPEGYAYYIDGEEAPLLIQQPVWVYSEGMAERESVRLFHTPAKDGASLPLIPLGASGEEIAGLLAAHCREQLLLKTVDGFQLPCDYRYNLNLIDTSQAGYYYPFVPEPPPGLEIAEADLRHNDMSVLVVDPDKVDLSGVRIDDANSYALYGEWLYEAESPRVWVSETSPLEEGAEPLWQPMEFSETKAVQSISLDGVEIDANIDAASLYLWFLGPPEEGAYWFQIRYEGGVSNYLQVVIDHEAMTAAVPRDGDRFGDIGGNNNPPTDPEPEPPTGPDPDPPTKPDPDPVDPQPPVTPDPTNPTDPKEPEDKEDKEDPTAPAQPDPTDPQAPGDGDGNDTATPTQPEAPDTASSDSDSGDTQAGGFAAPDIEIQPEPPALTGEALLLPVSVTQTLPPARPEDVIPTAEPEELPDPAALSGVAVTGAHLRAMLEANPDRVPFRHGDVQVWLPAEALTALALGDADVFAVRMEYQPLESLAVLLTVNNEPVPLGAAFAAGIPWDGAEVQCRNEDGEAVSCAYDADSGLLRITFDAPGTVYFTLSEVQEAAAETDLPLTILQNETPAPPAEDTGNAPILYAAGIVGVGGMGGTALWLRKRRVKR